ncbi:MAG: TonB-dependent receptor [Carboxylicivirga sp.]|jgi:TonB-dependent heme/hemoglobin receptor|nr:TonB-dependent receptor [Carboxylicivirga sp.]
MKKLITLIMATVIGCSVSAQEVQDTTKLKHYDIGEVVVNGSRTNAKLKDLPNKIEVVKVDKVNKATSRDVGELLKLNSGVDVIQYPGKLSSIGMRGFGPGTSNRYNALLINGLPAGTDNFSTLSLTNVQQVEIMKGSFSSLYGSGAMGGVINIVTPRSTGDIAGNASVSYGSYNFYNSYANIGGSINDKFNFDVSLYVEGQNDDYKTGSNNIFDLSDQEKEILTKKSEGYTYPNTTYKQYGGDVRLGFDISKDWKVDIGLGIYDANDVMTPGDIWENYDPGKKDITRTNSRLELQGTKGIHNFRLAPFYNKDFTEYYTSTEDDAYINSNKTLSTFGFQLQDRIVFGEHNVVVGIDNNSQKNETQRWSDSETGTSPYNPNYTNSATGILAQGNFKFFDEKLIVSAGGRYDNIKFKLIETEYMDFEEATESHNVFNPNIGIKSNVIHGINWHASFGTAFLTPTAFQKAGQYKGYYTYIGNPDLDPEKSATFDVGAGIQNYSLGIDFDLTFFHTDYKDMITRSASTELEGAQTFINANKAKMSGIEMKAAYDFGSLYDYNFSLKAYANFTFMLDYTLTQDETKVQSDIKYVRKSSGNFGLQYTDNKLSAKLNARYIGNRFEDNWFSWYPDTRPGLKDPDTGTEPSVLEHPKFMVFDASFYYNITSSLSCGVNVNNILDENYTEKDGYNMPGRNFCIKGIIKF